MCKRQVIWRWKWLRSNSEGNSLLLRGAQCSMTPKGRLSLPYPLNALEVAAYIQFSKTLQNGICELGVTASAVPKLIIRSDEKPDILEGAFLLPTFALMTAKAGHCLDQSLLLVVHSELTLEFLAHSLSLRVDDKLSEQEWLPAIALIRRLACRLDKIERRACNIIYTPDSLNYNICRPYSFEVRISET